MNKVGNPHEFVADLVSIIIPVYNCEQYLHRCLDSVTNQTHQDIEILLINDGSTDRSEEICNSYARKDDRVKVTTTLNSGPASARNVGIKNSQGGSIFFLDADDYIERDAIEMLLDKYKRHHVDIVVGDFVKIREGSPDSGHAAIFPDSTLLSKDDIVTYTRSYLKKPNRFPLFVYSWGRLFNALIIKKNNICFNSELRTFEDVAFNFEYLKYANGLFFLKKVLYDHLVHDNYMSASMAIVNNPKKLFGYQQALMNTRDYLVNSALSERDVKKEMGHAYICYTIIQLVRTCGQTNKSNKKMIHGLILNIVSDKEIRENLQFYTPSKGDSKVLPILIKLKFAWAIMLVCKYKAHKRYKKK